MKNIKALEPIAYKGKHYNTGETITGVDNAVAAELVYYKKAEVVKPSAPKVDNRDPEKLETRDGGDSADEQESDNKKAPTKKGAKNAKKAE